MLVQNHIPPALYDQLNWYAFLTRARAEKSVERLIVEAGIEVYLPLVELDRQWKDRKKRVALPLFPSYVFARLALTELGTVLRTPGVTAVLRPNGYPTPVREDEIESVRHLLRGINETGEVPAPVDYLQPGVEVVVISGPFTGMKGILMEERKRVMVRITALQQATSVQVPRSAVVPVAEED